MDEAGGHQLSETVTFLGYLAGVLIIPVVRTLWSRSRPTRWAGTVLAVAALVTAVRFGRLLQLWNAAGT